MSFSEVYKEKRTRGMASLRRLQFDAAKGGNVTMLIWLGKQWLNQAERPANAESRDDGISDEVEALLSELEME